MEYEILEGKSPVGSVEIQKQGLYLHILGNFPREKALQRVYGICGNRGVYLGIIDPLGKLEKRLSAGTTPLPEKCILSPLGPEEWNLETEKMLPLQQEASVRENRGVPASQKGEEQPPNIENGDREYENIKENAGIAVDPLLLADLPADYDYGEGGGAEADCPDL